VFESLATLFLSLWMLLLLSPLLGDSDPVGVFVGGILPDFQESMWRECDKKGVRRLRRSFCCVILCVQRQKRDVAACKRLHLNNVIHLALIHAVLHTFDINAADSEGQKNLSTCMRSKIKVTGMSCVEQSMDGWNCTHRRQ